jgi:hypothetical protein
MSKEAKATTISGALRAALAMADYPANNHERYRIVQAILPYLRPSENIETGAIRIMADHIRQEMLWPVDRSNPEPKGRYEVEEASRLDRAGRVE